MSSNTVDKTKLSKWVVKTIDRNIFCCQIGMSIGEALDEFFDETSYKQSEIVSLTDLTKE